MKLTYIPKAGVDCPGDGWPASSHDEPDAGLAAKKVASGWYRRENAKEKREADKALEESKNNANRKFDDAAKDAIAAADQTVTDAKAVAARTRQRLGKEE